MMDAVFTFHGVAPAVIGRGTQAFLDVFAETDVFLLNFIAESNGALDALVGLSGTHIMEKPLEDSESLIVRQRNDYVSRDIVLINVQHQVGKNPEVQRILQTGSRGVEAIAGIFRLH